MTPMRILEGNPTVSGQDTKGKKVVLSLATGWTTYITEQVEASPALDILFITSQPEDGATVYSSGVSSVSSGAM